VQADASFAEDALPAFPVFEPMANELAAPAPIEPAAPEPVAPSKKVLEVSVNPFTGKVKGRKVRLRLKADLDSRIIREMQKNDLLLIVGEKGDFWAVEAPADTKAYVFRSFVLDNTVEGNHVNVRLEPSLDAPIIGHLNAGDTLNDAVISAVNPKWLEISPPHSAKFYVAKEYIEYAGGPEVKAQRERRHETAEQLIDSSFLLSKAEIKKEFGSIDFDRVVKGYHTVIEEFTEFPELVDQAKEALASFQEEYLQKRISHQEKEEMAAKEAPVPTLSSAALTDKMRLWEPVEEALYLSWSNINDNRSLKSYYEEQRLASIELSGFLESYTTPVKNRPGDYILRDKDIPIAYLYSTQVNLQNLIGKSVKIVATPRPNNNFAFPAYYVISAE
jgi:hypothetical protein